MKPRIKMEHATAAILLHKAGSEVNEQNLIGVLEEAGFSNINRSKAKAVVAALEEESIEDFIADPVRPADVREEAREKVEEEARRNDSESSDSLDVEELESQIGDESDSDSDGEDSDDAAGADDDSESSDEE